MAIDRNTKTITTDVLYNTYKVKFPVTIKRKSNGKKECTFPSDGWKHIVSNTCDGDEENIAFRTGKINNLTVIDIDDEKSYKYFQEHVDKVENLNCHLIKTTNGYHLYFQYSQELDDLLAENCKGKVKVIKSIDIRSENCVIFYGKGYKIKKNCWTRSK